MGSSGVIGASGGGTPGALYSYQLLDTEGLDDLVEGNVMKVGVNDKWTQEPPATAASLGASLLAVKIWHAGSSTYIWSGGSQPDSGAYTNILFGGPNDPAAATGGRGNVNFDFWADTSV